jgi:hypothetical protein
MVLDLEQIRKRLNALKTQTNKSSNLWKPEPGKTKIRIIPYKFQPDNPFVELYFHFELGKRSYLSLKTFGEKDPIVEFSEKLKRTGDKSDWAMGRKMEPKLRTFACVVVRGKEQEGVKFWGFGKTIYEKLLATIAEPEWGDITDPHTGRDIIVEFKTKEQVGKDFPETDITVLPNQTPLTKDDELMGKLLDEQKEITEVYPKPTYDELKDVLDKYLNPEEEEAGVETAPSPETGEEEETTPKVKPKPKEGTKDVAKAFEDMFKTADKAK